MIYVYNVYTFRFVLPKRGGREFVEGHPDTGQIIHSKYISLCSQYIHNATGGIEPDLLFRVDILTPFDIFGSTGTAKNTFMVGT